MLYNKALAIDPVFMGESAWSLTSHLLRKNRSENRDAWTSSGSCL